MLIWCRINIKYFLHFKLHVYTLHIVHMYVSRQGYQEYQLLLMYKCYSFAISGTLHHTIKGCFTLEMTVFLRFLSYTMSMLWGPEIHCYISSHTVSNITYCYVDIPPVCQSVEIPNIISAILSTHSTHIISLTIVDPDCVSLWVFVEHVRPGTICFGLVVSISSLVFEFNSSDLLVRRTYHRGLIITWR